GNVVVNYNQAGNSNYVAAPQVQWNLTVTPATQSITVATSTAAVTYGQFVGLSATGGPSGNAVTFSIDPSSSASVTIAGSVLTVLSPGNLVIDYNQAGNSNYSAAPQVKQTLSVSAASQSIVVATSKATVLVGMTVPLSATGGGSGNPVTFSVDNS